MDNDISQDICRVCRCEATSERPLFYPCICTGSIKYIHQDCLTQWMRYSHNQYCELCGHHFRFQPIYSPDMPRVLPLRDVIGGILKVLLKAAKSWFHYTLVCLAWFGLVPLTAYRTYRYLFRISSFDMLVFWRFELLYTENLISDAFRGCVVVICTLVSFVGLVWLREQILHGGGPDWLERDDVPAVAQEAEVDADVDEGVDVEFDANEDAQLQAAAGAAAEQVVAPVVPAANAAIPADEPINVPQINGEVPADLPINNADPPVLDAAAQEAVAAVGAAVGAAAAAGIDFVNAAFRAVGADMENENEEPNWNPMEWDRAAEELTWERLLGLDGSLVFLEHVFWIISLNTLFIFVFAFCPYQVGNLMLDLFDIPYPENTLPDLHGLIITIFGYCSLGLASIVVHALARLFGLRSIRWFAGFSYIVVKVFLLLVVEIGVLPLICGWWLDICSLPLFDATLKDRKASFRATPGTSLFVHWMFGMVYVYYFAAFISLLREVLRPGVLWFIRNLNDPDYSPIHDMVHMPILHHLKDFVVSAMIFGTAVMLIIWLPMRILKVIWPTFLPYTLSGDSEVNELSLQLLLLHIILPGFLEQSHARIWLKGLLRIWCRAVSWILDIRSYLLGTDAPVAVEEEEAAAAEAGAAEDVANIVEPLLENNVEQAELIEKEAEEEDRPESTQTAELLLNEQAAELESNIDITDGVAQPKIEGAALQQEVEAAAAAEIAEEPPQPVAVDLAVPQQQQQQQAFAQRDLPFNFQPYTKPSFFGLRIIGLFACVAVSLIVAALITLVVPVWLGRQIMSLSTVGGGLLTTSNPAQRPHELYTAVVGIYLCWILSRAISITINLLQLGRAAIMVKIKHWLRVAAHYAIPVLILLTLLGIIPLLTPSSGDSY